MIEINGQDNGHYTAKLYHTVVKFNKKTSIHK